MIRGRLFFYGAAILLVFCVTPGWTGQGYVPGEIILKLEKLEPGVNSVSCFSGKETKPIFRKPVQGYFRRPGLSYDDLTGICLVKVKEGTEIENCEIYNRMPGVVYAEPNYLQHLCISPDDPDYVQQWSLPKIGSEAAWNIQTGSSDVIVAVVDTGIDYVHEDVDSQGQRVFWNYGVKIGCLGSFLGFSA